MDMPFLAPAASLEAAAIDDVLRAIHVYMALLAAGWGGLLLYVLVRFRRRTPTSGAAKGPGLLWPALAIAAVIAGNVIILAASALPAWLERTAGPPETTSAVHIRVIGEQFAWNVHYPGPDGTFGPTRSALISSSNPLGIDRTVPAARDDIGLLNLLTVPVERPIVIELSSRDVVHSFTLLEMRVRQDMTPGMTSRTWFTATRPGRWEIGCSQLCGLGHYRMRGTLTVLPGAAWEEWQASEAALVGRTLPRP